MTSSLKNTAVTGLIWSAIERFSVQGTQFIVTIILARLISPEDFGLIGMITVFIALSDLIINGGFSQALIQKKQRTQDDFSTVFYFNVIIAVFIYGLIYFLAPYVAKFYNHMPLIDILRILAISVILKSFCVVQNAILSIKLNFKLRTKINLISALLSGTIAIYMAYKGLGVYALIYQTILFSLLVSVFSFALIRWFPSLKFSFDSLKVLFNFGSKLLFASVVRTIVDNCYAILIGRFLSIRDVGYYTQGRNMPDVLSMNLYNVLQNVFFPLMSAHQD
ncbi:lipopolysaccharide biosynthesis protein, partial [Klebsiella michiganensis]|uniref:lipopolysaccharide biosynthesis protein n=1 Tax=Klebsiella michiganensis TaxID=1134687 RepID=UPI0025A2C099